MRVLVTGANGFVGRHLTEALLGERHAVRVLLRPGRAAAFAGVERVEADLAAEGFDAAAAVEGREVVFHVAGAVGDHVSWEVGRRVNVEATRRLAAAARDAGAQRFVFVSTVAIYGVAAGSYDEHAPRTRQREPYTDTKIEAEEALEEVFGAEPQRLRIVRPGMIYGPGDTGAIPRFRELLAAKTPLIGDGTAPAGLVHVRDVVRALLAVAGWDGGPRPGEGIFNVVGVEDRSWDELANEVAAHFALPRPKHLPRSLAVAIAAVLEALAAIRLAPNPPPLSLFVVRLLTERRSYPTARLREAVGLVLDAPVRAGLSEALAELAARG